MPRLSQLSHPGTNLPRWGSTASPRPCGPGSRRASPRPPTPRSRAGRRSRPATTRCSSRPPGRARRSPRSSGRSTGSAPTPVPAKDQRCRVLYVSPLRALAVDVEKNLRAPLAGHRARGRAPRRRRSTRRPSRMRTGDTPGKERQHTRAHAARHPHHHARVALPDAHVAGARDAAQRRDGDRRRDPRARAHQARRAPRCSRSNGSRRSPTGRRNASGSRRRSARSTRSRASSAARPTPAPRPVTIVDAGSRKALDVEVIVPVDDMTEPERAARGVGARGGRARPRRAGGDSSIWPHVHPRLLELIRAHRTTIVFCNARRTAERLAAHLNELAGEELVRAHHGSLSREQRAAGRVRAQGRAGCAASSRRAASSSASTWARVDLVVLVESPGSVARGLQRVGRAGHQVGEPSTGKIFPKYRGDLLEAAIVVQRMREGLVEEMRYPRNPLDVLAQQIVAACRGRRVGRRRARRARAPLRELRRALRRRVPRDARHARGPLSRPTGSRACGRASCGTASQGRVRGREGAQRVAVASGGTIPDRGLFGVFLPDGVRVGELDEEMVYESRVGECFVLGASTWRIEEITVDRVVVTPAPGEPAKTPFWKGDEPGRPLELGRALGALVRELRDARRTQAEATLRASGLDARARANLRAYLDEQAEATGAVPDDRTIVIERFPDEIGDWRVCILTPFGSRVHAPWALAIEEQLARARPAGAGAVERRRHHPAGCPNRSTTSRSTCCSSIPTRSRSSSSTRLPSTSLFASRFRENAARALLLPRRRPGERTPLWQQRQRAADLLEVASRLPDVPDAARDDARVPARRVRPPRAARGAHRHPVAASVRVVPVETRRASPFAQSLLFGWIAVYMYEGDAPLAERRAAALALDRDLLRDLLGAEELRELLDPEVLAELELELQRLAPEPPGPPRRRPARPARRPRPARRSTSSAPAAPADPTPWLDTLLAERRVIRDRRASSPRPRTRRGCATRSASRSRPGLPDRVHRSGRRSRSTTSSPATRARTCPFTLDERASRASASPPSARRDALRRLEADGRVVHGEFRPGGVEREWCDTGVLRVAAAPLARRAAPRDRAGRRRRRSRASSPRGRASGAAGAARRARRGARAAAGRRDPGVGARTRRAARARRRLPAGDARRAVRGRRARVDRRGRARRRRRPRAPVLPRPRAAARGAGACCPTPPDGAAARRDPRAARARRARRSGPTSSPRPAPPTKPCVLTALWDLVWAGEVTNDTFGPLRVPRRATRNALGRGAGRSPGRLTRLGPPAGAGRWSLVAPLLEPAPAPTEAAHAAALQLLERHGVVTREGVRAEGVARRVRRRLPGAARARGVGPGPPRLVRRRARRRAVRAAGRGRPPARAPHDRRRRAGAACSCSPPPIPRSRTAPRSAWPERIGRRPAGARRGRVRRARRRRVRGVRRARRRGAAHVRRARDRVDVWADALVEAHKEGRLGRRPARAHRRRAGAHVAARAPRCARPGSPTATRA